MIRTVDFLIERLSGENISVTKNCYGLTAHNKRLADDLRNAFTMENGMEKDDRLYEILAEAEYETTEDDKAQAHDQASLLRKMAKEHEAKK